MTNWNDVYQEWLAYEDLDPKLREELEQMTQEEAEDAFGQELSFGTAGIRGILGPGTNRMNKYIIRQTTEGLARWIDRQGEEAKERGVVISYDNRHGSTEFSLEAARVLASHGIKTYVFDKLHPTPVLSFAVRHLKCYAGIMITASHNPPNYNGYKVYGEDGGQFPPAAADELTNIINEIDSPFNVNVEDVDKALADGLIEYVGEEIVKAYLEELKTVTVNPKVAEENSDLLKIVFSPMHGTAAVIIDEVFEQAGFTNIVKVDEQFVIDKDFSTVEYPNPEAEDAFDLSKEYAEKEDADVLFATDPDADRLGVIVRKGEGDYRMLSGNQAASLMFNYLAENLTKQGKLPDNAAIVRSIVSTPFVDKIAKEYGVEVFEVLTGFKFVGDKIKEFEKTNSHEFLMGFEEAIGYLLKPFVRDKDSFQAIVLMAEIATYYKQKSMTLLDALDELYDKYGYNMEKTISVQYPGLSGKERMQEIMAEVRSTNFDKIAGYDVVAVDDYLTRTKTLRDGSTQELPQEESNVLRYHLADGSWLALRPSGTEPKIKLYMGSVSDNKEDAASKLEAIEKDIRGFIE